MSPESIQLSNLLSYIKANHLTLIIFDDKYEGGFRALLENGDSDVVFQTHVADNELASVTIFENLVKEINLDIDRPRKLKEAQS